MLDWIFQANQYFQFYNIPSQNRMEYVGFFMSGNVLNWSKWMHVNQQLTTWEVFLRALEQHFGPSSYENHQATLFKLRQLGSGVDYQAVFERISNRIIGLPADALLNCFISGLKPEIQRELAIIKPYSLTQTLGLAKVIEAKLQDTPTQYTLKFSNTTPPTNTSLLPKPFPPHPSPFANYPLLKCKQGKQKGCVLILTTSGIMVSNAVASNSSYSSVMNLQNLHMMSQTLLFHPFHPHLPLSYLHRLHPTPTHLIMPLPFSNYLLQHP